MLHIESWLEPQGWRPIPMDMPLVRQEDCPCCEASLEPVVTMSGTVGPSIEVGACPRCGYVGYIDRPTEQWFADFYTSDWDAKGKPVFADIQPGQKIEGPMHPAVGMVARANVPKGATILEVGAGFGWAAACVQRHLGYEHVTAVEPCQHRAKVIKRVFCLPVVPEIQPAHLIYSWHVLEHVYDPAAWVAKCAAVQQPGDTLCISVPNQVGEPTMGVLLFLPHLHSFTMMSLEVLLARRGYEVTDRVLSTCENLVVVARKMRPDQEPLFFMRPQIGVQEADAKMTAGLCLDRMGGIGYGEPKAMYWAKYSDKAAVCEVPEVAAKTAGLHEPRAARIWASHDGSKGTKITFGGYVELCVK